MIDINNNTAVVFPGQGSQVIGMGADLYEKSSIAKDIFDEVEFSMLVRNYGDKAGNIRMEISSSQSNYVGEYLTLGVNQAGVVSIRAPISESISETFAWSLYSSDGLITGSQQGNLSIPTNEKQDLSFSIVDVVYDSQSGIVITYSISLSEGKNRQVSTTLSYDDGSSEFEILLLDLESLH